MSKTSKKNSVLGRISKRNYTIIGAIILAIGVVHFSMQISFIQEKNLESAEMAVENKLEIATPEPRVITIEPEQYEVKKVRIITLPEIIKVPPIRQKEAAVTFRSPVKKKEVKEVRETRAARLRRAERILTGV